MTALRDWSFARVLLVSGAWVVLCLLLVLAWFLFQFRGIFRASGGSGGIGAVSIGLNVLMLAIPLGPPIVLMLAWLLARWVSPPSAA